MYVFRGDGETREVLLGQKLRGFGKGKIMGLGGNVEAGEGYLDAAIREAYEEAHITVRPEAAEHVATLTYRFPSMPAWDAVVAVFLGRSWSGEVAPSDELAPAWFSAIAPPFERMWDDERYWLSRVLAGEQLTVEMIYNESCTAVQEHSVITGRAK